MALPGNPGALFLPADYRVIKFPHTDFGGVWWGIESCKVSDISIDNKLHAIDRGPTEDIIHYFTLMSWELHYLDIIPKIENLH